MLTERERERKYRGFRYSKNINILLNPRNPQKCIVSSFRPNDSSVCQTDKSPTVRKKSCDVFLGCRRIIPQLFRLTIAFLPIAHNHIHHIFGFSGSQDWIYDLKLHLLFFEFCAARCPLHLGYYFFPGFLGQLESSVIVNSRPG